VRQHGTKFHAGNGTALGRDYTLYALIDGVVAFEPMRDDRKRVSVYPATETAAA
jgi:large subunit ribosomal protein L27